MSSANRITRAEFAYWRHSRLAVVAAVALVAIAIVSALTSGSFVAAEAVERAEHQAEADSAFLSQPARHPHRMVHYGHYVYRVPPPLAVVDPGVDAYTGTSVFLEGHRQNTATFAEVRETSSLTRFGLLTPAFSLQVLVPLLLIIVGYGCIVRERRSGTLLQLLTHGTPPRTILFGKAAALGSLALLAYFPLAFAAAYAATRDSWLSSMLMLTGYALYLTIWTFGIVAVSARARTAGGALVILLGVWLATVVAMPRVATEVATATVPTPSQVETNLAVNAELRELGDSHNANDPNFQSFRAQILAQYDVERVEDLPVNFRGLVAYEGEARTTEVLNAYAEEQLATERAQSRVAARFGLLSPTVALRRLSMIAAGTDLENHHRFLRAAEAHRFEFVQSLNRLHTERLRYQDDMRRNDGAAETRRARVSAENWSLLPEFDFEPPAAGDRAHRALPSAGILLLWFGLASAMLYRSARRVAAA